MAEEKYTIEDLIKFGLEGLSNFQDNFEEIKKKLDGKSFNDLSKEELQEVVLKYIERDTQVIKDIVLTKTISQVLLGYCNSPMAKIASFAGLEIDEAKKKIKEYQPKVYDWKVKTLESFEALKKSLIREEVKDESTTPDNKDGETEQQSEK